jgi:hypothetical protein
MFRGGHLSAISGEANEAYEGHRQVAYRGPVLSTKNCARCGRCLGGQWHKRRFSGIRRVYL